MKRSTYTLRRLLALVLVLVMVGSLFAGCNKKTDDPTVPLETEGPTEQTAAPTEEPTQAPTAEPTEAPTEPVETVPPVLMGTVNADNLNVRSEPYSTSDILKRLAINTRIEILEQKIVDGVNWGRIADGWINLNYVTIGVEFPGSDIGNSTVVENPNNAGTGSNATGSSNSTNGTVTTGLNIRKEADADSDAVGTYKKGDKVTILERSGNWGRTNKGWINTKYVDFTNSVTADSTSSSSGGGITTTVSNGNKAVLGYGTVVKTTSLAIRSGPGANYSQVSYVRMGERHPYYQTSSNGWVRFQKGWVNADYLTLEYAVESGTEGTVTATTLSVREEADYNSNRLATLAKGDEVTILETKGTWGLIEYSNGQYGWIDLDQVKLPTPVVSNYTTGIATITADALHIREKASATSNPLGTYKKGDKVTVTEVNGNWGKTADGWINLKFTKMEKTFSTGTGTVTATKLNIRSKPSTSGDDLGSLKNGDKVTILDTEGTWGKIEYATGKYGWISLNYVNMTSSTGSGSTATGKYTVTINRPDYGTVSSSTSSCGMGTTVTLTATPATGYQLQSYYVVDANGIVIPVTGSTFTMPASNVTVSATFVPSGATIPVYSVTCNTATNGSVTASHTANVEQGTKVALTIAPNANYALSTLTVKDAGNNTITVASDYSFIMPASNVTVTATFAASTATVYAVNVGSTSNGSITKSLSTAASGSTVTLNAAPATGYELGTISVVNDTTGNTIAVSGSGNTRTFIMPAASVTVTASFVKSLYSITVSSVTGGSATANATHCGQGTSVIVTSTAASDYAVGPIKVYGPNNVVVATISSGGSFTMPAYNVTVVPSFSKNPHSIATPTANAGGTVTVSPASSAVAGTTVTLTMANADDRFKLDTVTVKAGTTNITVSGTGNNRTFVMPAADVTEITATYVAIGVYKVNAGGANIRDAQNGSTVLATIPEGTIVHAKEGSTAEWIKVNHSGTLGWVAVGALTKQ